MGRCESAVSSHSMVQVANLISKPLLAPTYLGKMNKQIFDVADLYALNNALFDSGNRVHVVLIERARGEGRKLGERIRPSLFSSGVVAIASEYRCPNNIKQTLLT